MLADLKPFGRHLMSELVAIGGTAPLMKLLIEEGLMDGGLLTVTGKTLKENLKGVRPYPARQTVIRPLADPIKKTGHLVILRGNLAPEGAVAKITGHEGVRFAGRAIVFESEETALAAMRPGVKIEASCDGCAEPIVATVDFVAAQAEYTPPVIYSRGSREKLVFRVEAVPSPEQATMLRPGLPVDVRLAAQ